MPFSKGKSGNPGGKVKSRYRKMLDAAMKAESKKQGQTLIRHAVKVAYKDSTVLTAILKKLLPDLKSIEAKLDTDSPFRLILEYKPVSPSGKTGTLPKGQALVDQGRAEAAQAIHTVQMAQRPVKTVRPRVKTLRAMARDRKATAKTDSPDTGNSTGKRHSKQ